MQPDITAPGLNILAAWSESSAPTKLDTDKRRVKYNIISGTSMSCPHVSATAVLLKSIYPNWSSSAIRSAMMTTGTFILSLMCIFSFISCQIGIIQSDLCYAIFLSEASNFAPQDINVSGTYYVSLYMLSWLIFFFY